MLFRVASLDVAPATVHKVYALTRTIFRAAVEDLSSPSRRAAGWRYPSCPTRRSCPLTVAQVRAIADAAPPHLQALVILAAATGLRSGELLGLTVDRVDFLRRMVAVEQQLVYVSGQPPSVGPRKTKASKRTEPVPTFAFEILAEHIRRFPPRETDGLLFTSSKDAPVLRTTLNDRWRRTLRRAGLSETVKLHHLRHHYASVLIAGGESVKVVHRAPGAC